MGRCERRNGLHRVHSADAPLARSSSQSDLILKHALIDCYTVTHDLSFVNILLSLFAVIPETGSCPESLGELACFVGRQVPKNAPTRPIVLWPSTPVQRTLTTPPPAPPVRPTKRAVDGGDSSPFSRVFWHRVFSVAQVGSHPPPLTLTVGPPRHIRAHI